MNVKYEGAFLIARIHQTSGRIFETILRRYDLCEISPAQGRILFALWKNDNVPIQELARQTSLSKSTLTSMIDRLEQRGFLVRVPSEQDRREILIRLTQKDRSLQETYTKVSEEMMGISLSGFGRDEVEDLEDKLRRILVNLVDYEEKQKRTAP
ncbi:MAG: MarR family transcriptional regulator [Deltaproteobacteria bacterium]|nr:MarR family transcriptional regulator [Candidatus Zymogenaceae bacterium]